MKTNDIKNRKLDRFTKWLYKNPLLNMKFQCWVNRYTYRTRTVRRIIVKFRKLKNVRIE